jgi:hypothetical protein
VARLAEFARITGTLLIDPDGVYDPADVNDRVLLGFKGTMGEMLCRYRHNISYADLPVMPTTSCEGAAGLAGVAGISA